MAPYTGTDKSSPRTWGCFLIASIFESFIGVFPTHVGVFPGIDLPPGIESSLPHARGGVSCGARGYIQDDWSSPRTWGCFYVPPLSPEEERVFPTHVGVFPRTASPGPASTRLPHARGGVSTRVFERDGGYVSSPRTWGCFRRGRFTSTRAGGFPTHVGVFPYQSPPRSYSICLPHARGGVSRLVSVIEVAIGSSPRTWGCFPHYKSVHQQSLVFPTHVGVFLRYGGGTDFAKSLPHACGGVSIAEMARLLSNMSSPRTWGCF